MNEDFSGRSRDYASLAWSPVKPKTKNLILQFPTIAVSLSPFSDSSADQEDHLSIPITTTSVPSFNFSLKIWLSDLGRRDSIVMY